MNGVAVILLFAGYTLIWSALTGNAVIDEVQKSFGTSVSSDGKTKGSRGGLDHIIGKGAKTASKAFDKAERSIRHKGGNR